MRVSDDTPYGYDEINARAKARQQALETSAADKEQRSAWLKELLARHMEKQTLKALEDDIFDKDFAHNFIKQDKSPAMFDMSIFTVGPADKPRCKVCGAALHAVDGGLDTCLNCRRRAKEAYKR